MFTGTRSRLLLIGLALLAVAAVALSWFLGVSPQLQALERAKADTAHERSLNDIEQITVANLRAQNEDLDELKASLAQYQRGIPQAQQQPELLRLLSTAAANAGVTLTRITSSEILAYVPPEWQQPAPATGAGRLVGLTLELDAGGEPANLRAFLTNLQTLDRYLTVSGANFTTGEESSKVTAKATAWVLLSPEAAAQNAADEAPPATTPANESDTAEGEAITE